MACASCGHKYPRAAAPRNGAAVPINPQGYVPRGMRYKLRSVMPNLTPTPLPPVAAPQVTTPKKE